MSYKDYSVACYGGSHSRCERKQVLSPRGIRYFSCDCRCHETEPVREEGDNYRALLSRIDYSVEGLRANQRFVRSYNFTRFAFNIMPSKRHVDSEKELDKLLPSEQSPSISPKAKAIVEQSIGYVPRFHKDRATHYEKQYILPVFDYAAQIDFNLQLAVLNNPGKNCVELLFEELRRRLDDRDRVIEGQKRLIDGLYGSLAVSRGQLAGARGELALIQGKKKSQSVWQTRLSSYRDKCLLCLIEEPRLGEELYWHSDGNMCKASTLRAKDAV